jgi:hypothetical protein
MAFSRSRWAGRSGRPVAGAAFGTMLLLAGCGGGGGDGGTTNPTPAIGIALSSSTLSVAQGTAGNVTVNLTRSGGFTGDVAVAVTGLPTGVTVSSTTIASASTSATLTFVASATATTGNAPITVTATGSGVSATSASLALTVTAASGGGGAFTLSVSPTTVPVTQGQSAVAVVTITRTGGFTGAVNLSLTGAANGLSGTFAAPSTTGTTDTLTLAATGAATTGNQTLSIKGTATGLTDQTVGLTATVNAQSSSGNVTWQFCGTLGIPVWVAFQDGASGAWTKVTGTNDSYSFNITQAVGGIAYVRPSGTGFDMEVFYGTKADLQGRSTEVCGSAAGAGKTVTAPVVGLSGTDALFASLGTSAGTTSGATTTFTGVANGNVDLIAGRNVITINGTSFSFNLAKMIIRRNLNPANGSALAAIDFGSTEAFTPVTKNLTINNLGTDISGLFGLYFTSNNTFGAYFTDLSGTGAARTYPGVPAANQAAGDLHVLAVAAFPSLTNQTQQREALFAFHDATDKTVTLGPALTAPTVSALTATGYARLRAALTVQPEYNKIFTFSGSQTGAAPRSFTISQTAGYSSASPLNIDVPDLSAVSGFDVNWGIKTGTAVAWVVTGTGWPGTVGVGQPPFTEGASYMFANRSGTITP